MSCAAYDYQIAAGNDNVAGLTLITSITDGTNTFLHPTALGSYSQGLRQIRSDGSVGFNGHPSVVWLMVMSTKQYQYWRTTYAGGGYSGLVTIRSTTQQSATYANYDALMIVPQPSEADRVGDYYTVQLTMTKLTLIPEA